MIAVRIYNPSSVGRLRIAGRLRTDTEFLLGTLGVILYRIINMIAPIMAIDKNVALHPKAKPMILPRGNPNTMAMDDPMATILKALERCPSGASFTASGGIIDQKTACAQAIPRREIIKVIYPLAKNDSTLHTIKTENRLSKSFFCSIFEHRSIKGRETIATTHA